MLLMMRLLVLSLFIAAIYSDTCGGNCPSNRCQTCPCGTQSMVVDVPKLCARHNWGQACCRCIVVQESGGNLHAMNYAPHWKITYAGVFQIPSNSWRCNGDNAPCNADNGLSCAISLYQTAHNTWIPWDSAKGCGCA